MARQMIYPYYYPTSLHMNVRALAWDFLLGNESKATEACVLWLENEFERCENILMARHAGKSKQTDRIERADWVGYANIDLSAEDKLSVKGGVLDGESVLDIISEMLGTGHKISFTHDPEKDTVTAAATGVYKHCKNAGLTLTCFARSLSDVLTVMAYKHDVIAKGDWSSFTRPQRNVDDIG